jgi:hypothetical protein
MSHRFPVIDVEGPTSVELSLEQRYETVSNVLVHQFFQLYRILGGRYGWEVANDIAAEVPESSVPLLVRGYSRKFGIEGEGAALLARVMQAEFIAEGSDVAVVHEDSESATFDVLCSFGAALTSEQYSDVKIERGLCHEGCVGWMNSVGATVDPPVAVERQTWMGDGAARCRFAMSCSASTSAGTSD